ncbi:MAG TPA: AMP-binding protein [Candidatus Baltobacteraceae bacterium]|jgi:2-aminobenzoate-CoA ligase|nr:AMP-binding protein [Candidatus Baltobacteraceae bacterium]
MRYTAHVDTFAFDRLPAAADWPDLIFTLPQLQYPARLNCADPLLDRHVREGNGNRRCIVSPNGTWTYEHLMRTANRIARVLTEDLGVVTGNRVLLRAPNSPMMAACWFAVMKAGAIAVTTMPLYRAAELGNIIGKAEIRHALCDARLGDELRIATGGHPGFTSLFFNEGDLEERMQRKEDDFVNAETAADDVAIIGFTSGTTGKPKAAMHFHRDMLATCDTYGTHVLKAERGDLFIGSPPLGFTFGLGGLLLFPLYIGAATLLLEKAPPEELLAAIESHGVNVAFTAPIAYRAMSENATKYDLSSLRTCVSAGETLPRSVWNAWHERTGIKILDGIGSTEMLHIFIGSPEEDAIAGSTGRAVPGYVAQIHDDDGNALPPGEVGRLAVKGPTGCRYLDDDRQRTYVRGGWNYPGDAYRIDEDGYFYYVARIDDMIISAGYNISGPEVEEALLAHADVKECAVVAKPDPEHHTNIVKAYVVLANAHVPHASKSAELQDFVRSRIAPFKTPREIEFVTQLPRTETGKVQRFRLREQAASE